MLTVFVAWSDLVFLNCWGLDSAFLVQTWPVLYHGTLVLCRLIVYISSPRARSGHFYLSALLSSAGKFYLGTKI